MITCCFYEALSVIFAFFFVGTSSSACSRNLFASLNKESACDLYCAANASSSSGASPVGVASSTAGAVGAGADCVGVVGVVGYDDVDGAVGTTCTCRWPSQTRASPRQLLNRTPCTVTRNTVFTALSEVEVKKISADTETQEAAISSEQVLQCTRVKFFRVCHKFA